MLEKNLCNDCDTRWLSKLSLLSSIITNIDRLIQLKNDEEFSPLIPSKVEEDLILLNSRQKNLKDLYKVLKLFEEPIKKFQSKESFIYAVWPFLCLIKKKAYEFSHMEDNDFLVALGKSAVTAINCKMDSISLYHKFATFLHPEKRTFGGLYIDECEKEQVRQQFFHSMK